jgi:hypothetical protein
LILILSFVEEGGDSTAAPQKIYLKNNCFNRFDVLRGFDCVKKFCAIFLAKLDVGHALQQSFDLCVGLLSIGIIEAPGVILP